MARCRTPRRRGIERKDKIVTFEDSDDYYEYENYDDETDQDWQQGECDRCYGGDENGVTATGPLGPLYCACFIGQGASAAECMCGTPETACA